MAGPPPCLDQFGLGPRNATFRTAESGPPAPPRPRPVQQPERQRGRLVRAFSGKQLLVWALGAGGYTALLVASHGSAYADDLRGLAIAWIIIFGALNAHLILTRR